MLGGIEAFLLVLGGDAKADGHVDQLEQGQGADDGDHPRDRNAGELMKGLEVIALEESRRQRIPPGIVEDGVDCTAGEEAGEDGSQRASRAVHAEGVESVVVSENAL